MQPFISAPVTTVHGAPEPYEMQMSEASLQITQS